MSTPPASSCGVSRCTITAKYCERILSVCVYYHCVDLPWGVVNLSVLHSQGDQKSSIRLYATCTNLPASSFTGTTPMTERPRGVPICTYVRFELVNSMLHCNQDRQAHAADVSNNTPLHCFNTIFSRNMGFLILLVEFDRCP